MGTTRARARRTARRARPLPLPLRRPASAPAPSLTPDVWLRVFSARARCASALALAGPPQLAHARWRWHLTRVVVPCLGLEEVGKVCEQECRDLSFEAGEYIGEARETTWSVLDNTGRIVIMERTSSLWCWKPPAQFLPKWFIFHRRLLRGRCRCGACLCFRRRCF